ncbi:MAG: hypothetical protein JSV00_02430 [bacterium]|nr:MAG: hypothetical protein JSV00_02430 [bacterium]
MRRRWLLASVLLSLSLAAAPAAAAPDDEGAEVPLGNGYRGSFGISFRGAGLDVTDDQWILVSMYGDMVPTPTFSLESPVRFFGESRFGWYMQYSLTLFKLDRQDTPFTFDMEDLGTSVKGLYLAAAPVLVWEPEPTYQTGMGLALGLVSLEGDVIVYPDFDLLVPERHEVDVTGLATGFYIYSIYRVGKVILGVHVGMLTIGDSPYDYDVFEYSLDIGYRTNL